MPDPKPKMILVTGASGQLGRRLLPRLLGAGYNVRAHYRSREKTGRYCPTDATPIIGDLTDPGWLDQAAKGCNIIIHCAAMVSLRPGPDETMRRINVEGTKAIVSACLKNNVTRLIYISSIVTVGASETGQPLNETAEFNLAGFNIPYIETKKEAENSVLEANGPHLETIVVNPSIMISPPPRKLSEKELKKIPKSIPFYFDFGLNLVDTDDVVSGITSCIEKGTPGERYLLTGENVNPQKAFKLAEEFLGIEKPFLKIPIGLLYPIAFMMEFIARIRRKRPKFHRRLARLARYKFFYTNEKARHELGFRPKPLYQTIKKILASIR
jgi:dihydroflavonol-4-reductase